MVGYQKRMGVKMPHKLDTDRQVFFYEQEFYVLSNFSAFKLVWKGLGFDTSEHAYHWEKFPDSYEVRAMIHSSRSAHEAFKIAEKCKGKVCPDWAEKKVGIMKGILRAKVAQHEYVKRKLLETGDRELIEDSWRDSFWGRGPYHYDQKPHYSGQNMLGKLWMEIREELRAEKRHTVGGSDAADDDDASPTDGKYSDFRSE